jgi:tRNA A37 threonylcarbamoyladenosine biosynthesis protein TsaE
MKDIIVGRVTAVIDLETINVEVTQIVRNAGHHYHSEETVRFHTLEYRLQKRRNVKNKGFLEAMLKEKGVMCLVWERDAHGYLEADVYPLGH